MYVDVLTVTSMALRRAGGGEEEEVLPNLCAAFVRYLCDNLRLGRPWPCAASCTS